MSRRRCYSGGLGSTLDDNHFGAKIGVLGLIGAGKSTLLRLFAGEDEIYEGKIQAEKGITFGYLSQEPELDPNRTVREIVEEGAAEAVGLMKAYEEVSAKFAAPAADFAALMEEQARIQEKIDQMDAWDIDSKLDMAMGALRSVEGWWIGNAGVCRNNSLL